MANHKYLMAAKHLANRNQRRLNTKLDPLEKETDELFYWIMSRLEWSVQNCCPAKPFHSVTVNESFYSNEKKVLLKHGNVSEYLSQYVSKEEFYTVMKNVAEIFEEMGELVERGCRFGAICFTIEGSAELTVNMTAPN